MGTAPKRLPVQMFPQFPDNCTSVLKRTLTETVWRDLRVLKTKYGGRLANCIVAGVENPSLPVGVYACDPDAYKEYKDFFGPVIRELYNYDVKAEQVVKHNYDLSGLNWGRVEKTKYCVKYVQATGSRNLEGYPFVPLLDTANKAAIEAKLRKVIIDDIDAKMEANNMPEAYLKQLTEDGLMFDRHPGIERAVPLCKFNEGCFVYCNNDLSQVIWINADDHLQYFITEKNEPDLKTTCEKLFAKLKVIENNLPICHDGTLGFVTCNPCNLGTGVRAKVIVQLEKATGQDVSVDALSEYCSQYGVEVKSSMEGVYELTLLRTLQTGKTESDLIAGLLACLQEVLQYEERAILSEEEAIRDKMLEASGYNLRDMPQFEEINTSLVRPFINKESWLKYGTKATVHKNMLKDCLKPGIANHNIGLMALDPDCYIKFEEIFVNVAQICHEDYRMVDLSLLTTRPIKLADTLKRFDSLKCIVDGYLMWQGNLKDMALPPGLNRRSREECNSRLLDILDSFWKEKNLTLLGIDEDARIQELLYFKDLVAEKAKIPELSLDWPDQRRILRDAAGKLNILINVMNHLAIEVSLKEKTFSEDVLRFVDAFEKVVMKHSEVWAFLDKFGFLESLLTDIGNGFSIKLALKLPNASPGMYTSLAEQRKVAIAVANGTVYLNHKHKFRNIYQCIIDVVEVANAISRSEDQKEIFTSELLKTYEGVKTARGTTVNELLAASTANPHSSTVLFVASPESFNTFREIYTHALKKASDYSFDLSSFNYKHTEPVLGPLELPMLPEGVVGRMIEVSRNIEQMPFPAFMSSADRANAATLVAEVLSSLEVLFNASHRTGERFTSWRVRSSGERCRGWDLPSTWKWRCLRRRNCLRTGQSTGLPSSLKMKGILSAKSNRICIFVNGKDHIRMISLIIENDLNAAYGRLAEIHRLVGAKAKYAFDLKAGFLVSAPEEVGTGGFAIEVQIKGGKFSRKAKFGATIAQTVEALLSELKK